MQAEAPTLLPGETCYRAKCEELARFQVPIIHETKLGTITVKAKLCVRHTRETYAENFRNEWLKELDTSHK